MKSPKIEERFSNSTLELQINNLERRTQVFRHLRKRHVARHARAAIGSCDAASASGDSTISARGLMSACCNAVVARVLYLSAVTSRHARRRNRTSLSSLYLKLCTALACPCSSCLRQPLAPFVPDFRREVKFQFLACWVIPPLFSQPLEAWRPSACGTCGARGFQLHLT